MRPQTLPLHHGAEHAAASTSARLCSQVLLSELCFQAHHLALSLARRPPASGYKEKLSGSGRHTRQRRSLSPPLPPTSLLSRLPFMASNRTAADLTNLFGTVHSTTSTRIDRRAVLTLHERCGMCASNTDIWERGPLMKEQQRSPPRPEGQPGRSPSSPAAPAVGQGSEGRGRRLTGRLSTLQPPSR